jgi:hypothetical protein
MSNPPADRPTRSRESCFLGEQQQHQGRMRQADVGVCPLSSSTVFCLVTCEIAHLGNKHVCVRVWSDHVETRACVVVLARSLALSSQISVGPLPSLPY